MISFAVNSCGAGNATGCCLCASTCDGGGLFGADVQTVLKTCVLAFLLGLEVETGETPKVLLDDGLVDSRATTDTLSVIMSNTEKRVRILRVSGEKRYVRAPPVGLTLDVSEDDVLDSRGHSGYLPWNWTHLVSGGR